MSDLCRDLVDRSEPMSDHGDVQEEGEGRGRGGGGGSAGWLRV